MGPRGAWPGGFGRTERGVSGDESRFDTIGTARERVSLWLVEEPIGAGGFEPRGAQPASAKGTGAMGECIASGRPARTYPNASAIITASATPTHVRIR